MRSTSHIPREPAALGGVRSHNLGLLMDLLSDGAPRSRAELAKLTGLGKVTVSSLVEELSDAGLVAFRAPNQASGKGRPAQPLTVSGDSIAGLGIEIDVDRIAVCVLDLAGQPRVQAAECADNSRRPQAEVLAAAGRMARSALRKARTEGLETVSAVISVPGLVDSEAGRVRLAPNLGWQDVDLEQALRRSLGSHAPQRLRVENEANAAALSERKSNTMPADFVYVSLGVGVGAGVVMRGRLFRGSRGFGGELGHTTIQPGGPRCSCGNRGCLEALVGQQALVRRARRALGRSAPPASDPDAVLQTLASAAGAGHAGAVEVIADTAGWLGQGLSSYANLFDPELIVLGGYGRTLSEWLIPAVTAHLQAEVLAARWAPIQVRAASHGADARLLGAGRAAIEEVYRDPTLATRTDKSHERS